MGDIEREEMDGIEISIIVPAHNEELLLEQTLVEIAESLRARDLHFELICVENGSTDATAQILHGLESRYHEVRPLSLAVGDYGEAIYQGIEASTGRIVATFDVDLYDFAFFDSALELVRSGVADMVIASKRAVGAQDGRPLSRRILTAGFNLLVRCLVGLRASDAHGMKVLNRDELIHLVRRCRSRGSLFDVEFVLRCTQQAKAIRELPITVRELRPPRSSLTRRTFESFIGTIKLRTALQKEGASRT